MPTLPTPGGDNNTWGTELNEFLEVAHAADGTLKTSVLEPYAKPAGAWVSGTYSINQVVTHSGATFRSKVNNNTVTPGSDVAKWEAWGGGSGGAGMKSWEDAHYAIVATAPSVESGLTAIAADASTNDAPRIIAMLAYIKSTYGGGTLYLPPGKTINCNATLGTLPSKVRMVGYRTKLDFFFATDGITALTINENSATPLEGLEIHGNQWDANKPSTRNTTTGTGVKVIGDSIDFVNVRVSSWKYGVDLTSSNTYIIGFHRCQIAGNMVGVNIDVANVWHGRAGASSNSGERISFVGTTFANNDTHFWASSNGTSVFFTNCSLDFPVLFGKYDNAHLFFTGTHLEGTGTSTNPTYMFDVSGNSRLLMSNCSFVLAAEGAYSIYQVLKPVATANPTWGIAVFNNCDVYFVRSAAALAANAPTINWSEQPIIVPAGTTTMTVACPFISRQSAMKIHPCMLDATVTPTVTARITAADYANGTITITFSGTSGATTYFELDL